VTRGSQETGRSVPPAASATLAPATIAHAAAVGAALGLFARWWWPWALWLYEGARP